ncbi:ATP-dependent DNA helicase Hrp3, partial [Coemansia sp. IMI 209127]
QGKSGGIVGTSSGASSFSREELAAILKFGASSMFADDSVTMQQHKLDDMDLDKMLEDAEQADTSEAGVADDFLSQFKVADYGGSGLSWDDIIPEEDRQQIEFEEQQKQQEELLLRRRRARVSYAEDGTTMIGNGDGASSDSSSASSAGARRRGGGGSSRRRGGNDPKALSEKEIRALIRGVQKFGSPEHRFEQVVTEAELEGKNAESVKERGLELIKMCEDALRNHLHGNGADAEAAATGGGGGGDDEDLVSGFKRNAKAILLTFHGVHSVNAGVVAQRVTDLSVLSKRLELPTMREDPTKFRIGVPLKPVHHWSCLWGQREDAMLLVGIYRHGFGNWDKIQADVELGLQKKLFLTLADEKAASVQAIGGTVRGSSVVGSGGNGVGGGGGSASKRIVAPKATHLVRRGEYLLKVLREAEENKNKPALALTASSPAIGNSRRRRGRSDELSDANGASAAPNDHEAGGVRAAGDVEDGEVSEPESMDERTCKDMMRPVKRYLQRLRDEAEHSKSANSKIKLISECLLPIGRHIRSVIERKQPRGMAPGDADEDLDKLYRHLWVFVTYFWRSPVEYTKLVRLFERLEESNKNSPQHPPSAGAAALSPGRQAEPAGSPVEQRNSSVRSRSRGSSMSRSPSPSRSNGRRARSASKAASDTADVAGNGIISSHTHGNGSVGGGGGDHHSHHHHHRHHHHGRQSRSSSHNNGRSGGGSGGGARPSRRESRRQP